MDYKTNQPQIPHKPSKPLPDYTKECHNTVRQYICTHRRIVAAPTHIFPCIFYQHRNVAIACIRIRDPPKVVQMPELCNRCALSEGSSGSGKEFLQAQPQKKKDKDREKKRSNSKGKQDAEASNSDLKRKGMKTHISSEVHAAFSVQRGNEAKGNQDEETRSAIAEQKQHEEGVANITGLLAKSHISNTAAEKEDDNKKVEQQQQTMKTLEKGVSTSKSISENEPETKDLQGKTRGWVYVDPESTPVIPSLVNGGPRTRVGLTQRLFGKKGVVREGGGRSRKRKVKVDGSWAEVDEDSAYEGGDEEWEDLERVIVGVEGEGNAGL